MKQLWTIIGGRKFLVLVLGTVGLLFGRLDSWSWVVVAGLYIGGNVAQKVLRGDGNDKKV